MTRIEAVIHPQSIIHNLVAYQDGSVIAQMGWPDMRVLFNTLSFIRNAKQNNLPALDLIQVSQLTFEAPDSDRFPCLRLAREAGKIGGTMTAVL